MSLKRIFFFVVGVVIYGIGTTVETNAKIIFLDGKLEIFARSEGMTDSETLDAMISESTSEFNFDGNGNFANELFAGFSEVQDRASSSVQTNGRFSEENASSILAPNILLGADTMNVSNRKLIAAAAGTIRFQVIDKPATIKFFAEARGELRGAGNASVSAQFTSGGAAPLFEFFASGDLTGQTPMQSDEFEIDPGVYTYTVVAMGSVVEGGKGEAGDSLFIGNPSPV